MKKVLKFTAPWCGPCKMLTKAIDKMIAEGSISNDVLTIESVDIDADPTVASKYSVRAVPTMIMLDGNGVEIKRQIGMAAPAKLLEWLNS